MKALILNSGMGSRMGVLTSEHPKCMTEISSKETILSRQLTQLCAAGIEEVVMTTGLFDAVLVNYCQSLDLPIHFTFVKNPKYDSTNYIYSIYCAREHLDDDIILMHGDLVFENEVLDRIIAAKDSSMAVSSTLELPEKDFKAVVRNGKVEKVGIEFFNEAMEAQALYKLKKEDWKIWLDKICEFCESGNTNVYAENALNEVTDKCVIKPADMKNMLCAEIDNPEDLAVVSSKLKEIESRVVYMCFSTDIIHGGHIAIIKKAQKLGKLIIGVLSDEAVASYKRMPLVPFSERKIMFENISGVYKVVEQKTLSYKDNLKEYRPDIVVHGDDWQNGFQRPIRDEVTSILATYGGRLVEYPYASDDKYKDIDNRQRADLAMPDIRRGSLRRMLDAKGLVTAMEAHDGLTGLVVENTVVYQNGGAHQYDAMWVSSLCDSTAKGKPDIELVDMTSRFRTIEDITEVTTKPIIFDGDTGGKTEHFVYTVRSLERLGVSMVIIEDKTGLKKNSLFGTEVVQTQDSIESFSEKIRAGKKAQRTKEFMICARIESLILEQGMEDALERAFAFVAAGADAIMIHSRKKDPSEIFEFLEKFREKNSKTPVVLVPTSFNSVKEEEWKERGANVIIYANQLMRATVPAIQEAARIILENHRAEECDKMLMPFKDIIRLIPDEV
ncbi:phosphoenolpyruvate mutase [Butyrivibrio sp. DSM 10294]|uniref:phosphoenolpyruvate mutase n=2 Tax=unclassified Butyrivibrio TaxID=2639466 RepID=UPI00234F574F|nr:phosphoenolpyruvate mutase [Butyrivibrio sp. DSM 10294]MDC7294972.1 phosphoenolpyruvate mutase [Butyrivibrio sp. DSM 10294]